MLRAIVFIAAVVVLTAIFVFTFIDGSVNAARLLSFVESIVGAIAWPFVVVAGLCLFRREISQKISNMHEMDLWGAKSKFERFAKDDAAVSAALLDTPVSNSAAAASAGNSDVNATVSHGVSGDDTGDGAHAYGTSTQIQDYNDLERSVLIKALENTPPEISGLGRYFSGFNNWNSNRVWSIRRWLPVSTQSSRRAFGKAVVQRRVQRQFLSCDFMEYFCAAKP